MKIRKHLVSPVAAALLVLVTGATATGMAQTPPPAPGKMPQHMEGMQGMGGMMGPHHVLAMAYRDNLATFAKALQGQVAHSKTVDLDLARPAVAEMRRSFDQMQQHHQAQMQMMMMGDSAKAPMAGTMQHMETHLTALGEHLTALEAEVSAGTPDPKKVSAHTSEILKQCAGMSAMPAKAKPHTME
jgi:hypothetical protein